MIFNTKGEVINRHSTSNRLVYNAKELSIALGISQASAYNLMHSKGFPAFTVGKRLLVAKSSLAKWLDNHGDTASNF